MCGSVRSPGVDLKETEIEVECAGVRTEGRRSSENCRKFPCSEGILHVNVSVYSLTEKEQNTYSLSTALCYSTLAVADYCIV